MCQRQEIPLTFLASGEFELLTSLRGIAPVDIVGI